MMLVIMMTVSLVPGSGSAADNTPKFEDELAFYALEERMMTTATKTKKTLRQAPAIATVITGDEIRSMGARNLTDVLKTVPGFGVSINETGWQMFEVRGIRTRDSEKILVMIDGHRVNNSYYGSALVHIFDNLSVEKVKQVEIIRGPGSALYGANAFVGVINVITKDGDDVNGADVTVAGGNFDTKKINLIGGKSFKDKDIKVFGSVDYSDTDGDDVIIKADTIAGTPFSMTPGNADLYLKKTEALLKVSYGNLIFKGHFLQQDKGSYIGFANALTDDNTYKTKDSWAELEYSRAFTDKFSASLRTYFDYFKQETKLEVFPEGFPGYPDGGVGTPGLKNRTLGGEFQFDYDLFKGNHLIVGFNYEHIKQYDVGQRLNFDPWTFEPIASLQDVSSWANFNKDVTRKVWAVYVQDEWAIRNNLSITAGVRYDNYDDFGSTTNPRAGLVWNFLEHADLKLLYGQAFRAPNFIELYNDSNPSAVGNPNLEPEKIKTYEASLGYRFGDSYMMNLNYFHNDIDDLIAVDTFVTPAKYTNLGGAEVSGIEVVLNGRYNQTDYWKVAYTWQDPKDKDTDKELPFVPTHRINFSANYGISNYLEIHTDVIWTGERPRPEGDTREDSDAYTTVDLALTAKNFFRNLELQLAFHNLFDAEYEDPDLSGVQKLIPYDYPREGLSALFSVTYRF
ncbi:TonB-dependent receptor plug domain-containing protein [Desulfonema magnum]|nr:TonB-dependent receptor [Desulfonema magnum]